MSMGKGNGGSGGQATVEMALVLPLFLLFLGGILVFGFAFYDYLMIGNVAAQVVREASLGQISGSQMVPQAQGQIQGKLYQGGSAGYRSFYCVPWSSLPSGMVSQSASAAPTQSSQYAALQISIPIDSIFNLPILPSQFTVSSQAVLPMQAPCSTLVGSSGNTCTSQGNDSEQCQPDGGDN